MNKFCMWIAFKIPRKLVYWAAIRLGAYATQDKYSDTIISGLFFMDALKRWEGDN